MYIYIYIDTYIHIVCNPTVNLPVGDGLWHWVYNTNPNASPLARAALGYFQPGDTTMNLMALDP